MIVPSFAITASSVDDFIATSYPATVGNFTLLASTVNAVIFAASASTTSCGVNTFLATFTVIDFVSAFTVSSPVLVRVNTKPTSLSSAAGVIVPSFAITASSVDDFIVTSYPATVGNFTLLPSTVNAVIFAASASAALSASAFLMLFSHRRLSSTSIRLYHRLLVCILDHYLLYLFQFLHLYFFHQL